MLPRLQRFVLISAITLLAALVVWPYHDGALRYGLPVGLIAAWASLVLLARAGIARWVLLALPILVAIPFCLPGKAYDAATLRTGYVSEMKQMKGTRYLWGGEGRKGIDCSGLPRRALRDALLDDGWRRLNGRAFRDWAEQWWYDASAKALSESYRGFTCPVGVAGRLRDLDFTRLDPGDLAVTADGRHVMVFIGDGEWIQADPGPWQVAIGRPASDPNPWFDTQVTLHRWCVLE